jgi:hypothetical protein
VLARVFILKMRLPAGPLPLVGMASSEFARIWIALL